MFMRYVARLLASLFVTLLISAPAIAAAPTPESIDTLLQLTKIERLLDSMMVSVNQTMQQSMRIAMKDQPQTPEQQRLLDNMSTKFATIFREEMTYAKLRPLYVRVYSESFTQDEVDGLIAFYRTPAGTALIEKMPVVMQRTMAEMRPMMAPMLERMKAAAQEAVEESKAQTKK
jgi:hypothetical protein